MNILQSLICGKERVVSKVTNINITNKQRICHNLCSNASLFTITEALSLIKF